MTARRNLRATVAESATTWEGTVIAVNLYARALTVNTKDLGTFNATISRSVDVGTPTAPKIHVGDTVRVERMRNHYLVTDILAKAATQISNQFITYSPQVIGIPEWVPPYPRIVGTQLEGLWTVVADAIKYRVYSNTTPSQVGATLVGEFFQNQFSRSLNLGIGELIENGGFESGDFTRWNTVFDTWTVTSVVKNGGAFSVRGNVPPNTDASSLSTIRYPIKPDAGNIYVFTADIYLPSLPAGAEFTITFNLFDVNGVRFDQPPTAVITLPATNSGFIKHGGTNDFGSAAYVEFVINPLVSGTETFTVYIDNVSLVGPTPVQSANLYYAVCAESGPGFVSPPSSWLQAALQKLTIGSPDNAATEIDYANARVQTSNFVAQTDANPNAGSHISPDGIDGNLLAASQRATLWHDESVVLAGNALTRAHDAAQNYGVYVYQSPAANSDSFEQKVFLRPGWYTFNALGATNTNLGKVDWYLDDVLLLSGQDWYAASLNYNVIKSSAVPFVVTYGGAHTLKAVVNGKNASSSDYFIALTKMWFAPASVAETYLYLKFNYPQYSSGLIHLGVL